MSKKKKTTLSSTRPTWLTRQRIILLGGLLLFIGLLSMTRYESYASLYDADYVGAAACGECHKLIYERWQQSPHANMTHPAGTETIVGDFNDSTWTLPPDVQQLPDDDLPAARMYQDNGLYYMALRHPETGQFVPFKIDYVVGYQYRQTYLTRESGGVLRRLPLEWSVAGQQFFPYWNFQEGSTPSVADLWAQMTSLNSAWNLFCARCHTTHLVIFNKDANHTLADTAWVDDGIACEACHGPGSHHVNYYAHNYVNRLVAFINGQIRNQPTAYIANPPKLTKGQDLSTCARCHGPDITMSTTEVYRVYEPGYSQEGRINDLSEYFKQFPLQPGRDDPTVEVWEDGTAKGIAMVFRSFIESVCYEQAEVRCYDCHDPHNNKAPAEPGLLTPSEASNNYCLACHTNLETNHSQHEVNTEGSYCYDCHLPYRIINLASGTNNWARNHTMSYIPQPADTIRYGAEGSPNACNLCHTDQSAEWADQWVKEWWGN